LRQPANILDAAERPVALNRQDADCPTVGPGAMKGLEGALPLVAIQNFLATPRSRFPADVRTTCFLRCRGLRDAS
jgi:hypothetical protein